MFKKLFKTLQVRQEIRSLRKVAKGVTGSTQLFILFKIQKLLSE